MRHDFQNPSTSLIKGRVAVVVSSINVRRLLPGMRSFVASGRDYWIVDIYRPTKELRQLIQHWNPLGIITEWLPKITPEIISWNFPTVVATRDIQIDGVGSVDVDNLEVGRSVAHYFSDRGYKHFAFVGNQTPYSSERKTGFENELKLRGQRLQSYDKAARSHRQYIEHWHEPNPDLANWLHQLPKPVAILAAHDPLGRTLAETCRDAGLKVPEEVAIVGANNDENVCGMAHPPLSSVDIPWTHLGFETARLMEEMLRNPQRKQWEPRYVPPSDIITRRSSERLATKEPTVLRAVNFIRERVASGIRVSDVVKTLRVSRRTLERAFITEMGHSPRDEIMHHRLKISRSLLKETDLTMPIIAERSGFSNAEIFSVNFRKYFKETPSQYRKRFRMR